MFSFCPFMMTCLRLAYSLEWNAWAQRLQPTGQHLTFSCTPCTAPCVVECVMSEHEDLWQGLAMALTEKLFSETLACLFLMRKSQKEKLKLYCCRRVISKLWRKLNKCRNIYKASVTFSREKILPENMVVVSYLIDWCKTWTR